MLGCSSCLAGISKHKSANGQRISFDGCTAARLQLDCNILSTLQDCCWPERQAQCYRSMMAAGQDALDVLAAAAHSNSGRSKSDSAPFLGLAYQAHVALHYVKGGICAKRLREVLNSEQEQQQQQSRSSHAALSTSSAATSVTSAGDCGSLLSGALLMVSNMSGEHASSLYPHMLPSMWMNK